MICSEGDIIHSQWLGRLFLPCRVPKPHTPQPQPFSLYFLPGLHTLSGFVSRGRERPLRVPFVQAMAFLAVFASITSVDAGLLQSPLLLDISCLGHGHLHQCPSCPLPGHTPVLATSRALH